MLNRISYIAVFAVTAICSAMGFQASALAHPHVWVTVESEVVYDEQKAISGFRHRWTFDAAYSLFAVEGRDLNSDGIYDRKELQELAEVNIASLKEFDFFTFPKLGEELLPRESPQDYWLEFKDDQLTLIFTLPMSKPVPATDIKRFTFSVYDPTFYVDFSLAEKEPIRLSAAPAGCKPLVKTPAGAAPQPPKTLMETDFNDPSATMGLAEQYAKIVAVECPAS